MAEPKKRTNRSKRNMRRMHDKVEKPSIVYCEQCHSPKQSHQVCYVCGTYKKEQVLNLEKSVKKQ